MPESDASLLSKYVSTNDPLAFDQLARRYRGMVYATARRVTGNLHDAEDVAQNCFVDLVRRAGSVKTPVAVFLHKTATHRAIDILRERQSRRKHEHQAAAERSDVSTGKTGDWAWDDISPEVDRAIDDLPTELRTVIILFYLRGLTDLEIASELGTKRRAVSRRLSVATRMLRRRLSKQGNPIPLGVLAVGLKSSSIIAIPQSLAEATGRMALASDLCRAPSGRRYLQRTASAITGAPLLVLLVLSTAGLVATAPIAYRYASNWNHPALGPYDRLNTLYSPYLPQDQATGFAWHAASMSNNVSNFWRGSQPLFYDWCNVHCRDWLDDPSGYSICQSSPNLEDVDRMAAVVNPEDSARVPVEIELLQGVITLRLTAARETTPSVIIAPLCEAFRQTLLSPVYTSSPAMPQGLSGPAMMDSYLDENGSFNSFIYGRPRKRTVEFLRTSDLSLDQTSAIIARAIENNPALGDALGSTKPVVKDVRIRVRYDAVDTQGPRSYLVQLQPTAGHPAMLLEMNQQCPSPAELSGFVPRDNRSPARRAAEDAMALAGRFCGPISWADANGESYSVSLIRLPSTINDVRELPWVDPVSASRAWATAVADSHLRDPHISELAARITPRLENLLAARSDEYLQQLQNDFQNFTGDPRVAHDRSVRDALVTKWVDDAANQ